MSEERKKFLSLVDVYDFDRYSQDISDELYFGAPLAPIIEAEEQLRSPHVKSVAYLSMEYGLATSFYNSLTKKNGTDEKNKVLDHEIFSNMRIEDFLFALTTSEIMDIPLYSGGLGVLAGDTLKSAADMGLSMAAIGVLWEKGYFKQNFWFKYGQVPEEMLWDPFSYPGLIPLNNTIKIDFKNESVHLRIWKYYVYSYDKKHVVPLLLLDANLKENNESIRALTDRLYRSTDTWIRIMQRSLLGIGAVRVLQVLGYSIDKYHLNEGHAAMAFVEMVKAKEEPERNTIRKNFIYTCHTPVAAGHDRFPVRELEKILPEAECSFLRQSGSEANSELINMTLTLMSNCEHVNTVSKKHQEITAMQFPHFREKIRSVTNGVHVSTWISDSFAALFEKYKHVIGDFRSDPSGIIKVATLREDPQFRQDLWAAHQENKKRLANVFERWRIKEDVFTLCWARRIAQYKRPSLLFQNAERLLEIAKNAGPLQIFIAGKAHPADNIVGTYIDEIMNTIDRLNKEFKHLRIIMLENYDIFFGKLLSSSVDVWLNNPLPPFEASGTSGMKAVLNGVVQLTTLDGWVGEVSNTGIGEIFGYRHKEGEPIGSESNLRLQEDSQALYASLEKLVRSYYRIGNNGALNMQSEWLEFMINCIAEGSYFNSHRMLQEYKTHMWQL